MLHSSEGSWPCLQTIDKDGNACQGQTLYLITETVNYGRNKFYDTSHRMVKTADIKICFHLVWPKPIWPTDNWSTEIWSTDIWSTDIWSTYIWMTDIWLFSWHWFGRLIKHTVRRPNVGRWNCFRSKHEEPNILLKVENYIKKVFDISPKVLNIIELFVILTVNVFYLSNRDTMKTLTDFIMTPYIDVSQNDNTYNA